jgi:hypothetical protein
LTQVVWKRFSGDRDEILNQEADLGRNNDSPGPPSRFNYARKLSATEFSYSLDPKAPFETNPPLASYVHHRLNQMTTQRGLNR